MNKQKIVKNLTKAFTFCLCCVFCVGVLCSTALTVYGADEPTEGGGSARITDLTGYTVTVPSGWSVISGYDVFYNLDYQLNGAMFGQLIGLGYSSNQSPTVNTITFDFDRNYTSSQSFTIYFMGGADVINTKLINWLYDNNATFVNNNEPNEPDEPDEPNEPIPDFSVNINLTSDFIVDDFTFEIDYLNGTLSYDYNSLDELVDSFLLNLNSIDYIPLFDSDLGLYYYEFNIVTNGYVPYISSYNVIGDFIQSTYFGEDDSEFAYWYNGFSYTVVIESRTPPYDISTTYSRRFYLQGYTLADSYESGYTNGYKQGLNDGYNDGYLTGKTEGQSSNIGENLIGSGFSAITGALNQIIVYQSSTGTIVTLWVIISGAVGIALFIWILKLFAGG